MAAWTGERRIGAGEDASGDHIHPPALRRYSRRVSTGLETTDQASSEPQPKLFQKGVA
jgi:hypothetical protein